MKIDSKNRRLYGLFKWIDGELYGWSERSCYMEANKERFAVYYDDSSKNERLVSGVVKACELANLNDNGWFIARIGTKKCPVVMEDWQINNMRESKFCRRNAKFKLKND